MTAKQFTNEMNKPIKFKRWDNIPRQKYTFVLGEEYIITAWTRSTCRFIKVTPKGFNLLNLYTSKCVFRTHLYSRKYVGRDIPKGHTKFTVMLPNWVRSVEKIPKERRA